jgi:hypothetical protein
VSLTSIAAVRLVPGLTSSAYYSDDWLNDLIAAADAAVKNFCKRDLELTFYGLGAGSDSGVYSGDGNPALALRQYPVWLGQTTVAAGSDGSVLPVTTLNVASTVGFPPAFPSAPAALTVQTGLNTRTWLTYTGKTPTSFLGCSEGSGTLSVADGRNRVTSPVVFLDAGGSYGQAANAFPDASLLALGSGFAVELDGSGCAGGNKSGRGLLRFMGSGGVGVGWPAWYPGGMQSPWQGKLAGRRLPGWPRGFGNVRVLYAAGYMPVPADLQQAATSLAAYMVRTVPNGAVLSSESLGAYSYSVLTQSNDVPEIGSVVRTLARYRETSF